MSNIGGGTCDNSRICKRFSFNAAIEYITYCVIDAPHEYGQQRLFGAKQLPFRHERLDLASLLLVLALGHRRLCRCPPYGRSTSSLSLKRTIGICFLP